MRVPNINKIKNTGQNLDKQFVTENIEYYSDPVRKNHIFSDERSKVKFIRTVERIVRMSYEYGEFIKFLKQEIDMTHCSYFNNLSNADNNYVSIEIHHAPFTLYDITYIVLSKHIDEEPVINALKVAEDVMKLHFEGLIGLIPLSKTVHELVHSGAIYVPTSYVFGNVGKFYNEYEYYMTEEQKDVLMKNVDLSDMLENSPELLKTRFVYLNIDGMEFPRLIEI